MDVNATNHDQSSEGNRQLELQVENHHPLGCWDDLHPTFRGQILALFKKHFLIKIRKLSTIIEIILAFGIILVALLAYYFGTKDFSDDRNPHGSLIDYTSLTSWFMLSSGRAIFLPDRPLMHYLIGNMTFLPILMQPGPVPGTNYNLPGYQVHWINDTKKMEDLIYDTQDNNFAIQWKNVDSPNALTNPDIKIYVQTLYGNPKPAFYLQVRDSLIKMRSEGESDTLFQITSQFIQNLKITGIPFSHPSVTQRSSELCFTYAILASIAIIVATMPDMELLFREKELHVTAYSFLMGMTERAYWFTNYVVSFFISFFVYLFISLVLTYWFGMTGNDFGMTLLLSILFINAQIWFQFMLSTFMNKASQGRSLTICLILMAFVISFIFQFATLKNRNGVSMAINCIFSLIPLSAYQLYVMQAIYVTVGDLPPFRWSNIDHHAYVCPPWIPFLWTAFDGIFYFVLFLLFNSVNPRAFGIPPAKIRQRRNKELGKCTSILDCVRMDDLNGDVSTAVRVKHLTKIYPHSHKQKALDDISFAVQSREVIVVIGPNGAGKSTLINCICDSVQLTEGDIALLGSYEPSVVGVCFQENVLIRELSIKENFEFFGAIRGISKEVMKSSIDYLSSNMQLGAILDNRAGDLSGGQKRKLCIGLSLLGNPRIVLMDEPTAGVDVQARQLIWKMISNLKETTSIITSHALEEAETVSSRLFIMSEGKIKFSGTSTELRKRYQCGYILRVDRSDGTVGPVLDFVRRFLPSAELVSDRTDQIRIPVDDSIGRFLYAFRENRHELGVNSYSFAVEQLEDMLLLAH